MTMPSPVVATVSVEWTFSSRSGLYCRRISTLEPKPPVARTKALPVNSYSLPSGSEALTAVMVPLSSTTNSLARMLV